MLIFDNNIILFVEWELMWSVFIYYLMKMNSLMVVLLDNLNSDLQWANLVMTSTFFLPVKRGLM